jgi:hypothetical protein
MIHIPPRARGAGRTRLSAMDPPRPDPPGTCHRFAAVEFTVCENFLESIAKVGQSDLSNVALVRWLFALVPWIEPEPSKILSENLIWRSLRASENSHPEGTIYGNWHGEVVQPHQGLWIHPT